MWRVFCCVVQGIHCSRLVRTRAKCSRGRRGLLSYSHVDNHVVAEILISRDESVSLIILETDTFAGAIWVRVEAIEVLDGRHDGLGTIVRVYLHAQGQARTKLRGFMEEEFELNMFRGDPLVRRNGATAQGGGSTGEGLNR